MLLELLVPYYGRLDYLMQTVESALDQDSDRFRLTVVDDADPSPGAGEYVHDRNDPRLRYIRNERNLGLNRNFQRCLDLAEAPYLSLVGCDDLLLPGYVQLFEGSLQGPSWDILQPGVTVIDSTGTTTAPLADRVKALIRPSAGGGGHRLIEGAEAATSLCIGDWMYFPSLIWRTEVARAVGFSPALRVALDLQLLVDVLARGGRVALYDEVVFAYRRHPASQSSPVADEGSRFAEEALVYAAAADEFRRLGWNSAARMAGLRPASRVHALLGAAHFVRSGKVRTARHLVGLALAP